MEQHTQHASDAQRRRPASGGAPHRRPSSSGRPASGERRAAPHRSASGSTQHRRPPQKSGSAPARRPAPDGRRPAQDHPSGMRRPPQHRRPASGSQTRRPAQSRYPSDGTRAANARYADSRRPTDGRRPANGRRPSNGYRPADGRRPVRSGSAAAGARRPQGRRRRASVTRLSVLMFVIVVILYIVIASVYMSGRRKKANAYLAEYEASRPQYKIEEYVASLGDGFFDDMLRQAAAGIQVSDYETTDGIMDTLQMRSASTDAAQPYSYIKKEDFTESRPTYYIMRGEEAVAAVTLERSGWTDKYSFPVWRVNEPQSLLEVHAEPAYEISVTMPQGCVLNVNGNPVPTDIMTEEETLPELNTMELNYSSQPMARHCEMSGFYMPPTVEVKDAEGNRLTPESTPDLTTAHHEYVFRKPADPAADPALKERAEALTRAYMDYVINKDKDRFNNLAVLNNYLMPGSEAAVLMQTIINDIYWNNQYDGRTDDVKVTGIRTYSDKLCTADVHFDTTLTKAGVGTNEYISTISWTLVNNGWGWYATSFELHMDQD